MPSQHVLTQEEWVAAMAKRAMDRIRSKYGSGCIVFGAAQPEKEEDPLP